MKQRWRWSSILLSSWLCSGCWAPVWTGASLVYDRHHVYEKMADYRLDTRSHYIIFQDAVFSTPASVVDVTVFHQDILVAGHVPAMYYKQELLRRLAHLPPHRHLYDKVIISKRPPQTVKDAWITAQVRSRMFGDSDIDLSAFKVVTTDGIVYLLGEARKDQVARVVQIARNIPGVQKVVVLLQAYSLQTFHAK